MTTRNGPGKSGDARRAHRAWPPDVRVEVAPVVVERRTPTFPPN